MKHWREEQKGERNKENYNSKSKLANDDWTIEEDERRVEEDEKCVEKEYD